MNITITGFMGTGKTAVGRRLAKRLGWRFVDVDRLIEQGAGMSVPRIFAERGEAVFRRLERRCISRVARAHHQVIATGGGAFVDPHSRARLKARGTVVCLTARPQVILARVGRRIVRRPMLTGKGSVRSRIKALLAQRAAAYAQADLTIDTSRLTVDAVVDRIVRHLSPSLCKSWRYLLDHASTLSQRHGGKYVVVVGERVVASGKTQLQAFQKARLSNGGDAGIYYVPLPEELPTAL